MRATVSGPVFAASRPIYPYAPGNIFQEDATLLPRSVSQVEKEKFANQAYYNTPAQKDKFFGYSGQAYGGAVQGSSTTLQIKEFTEAVYLVPPSTPRVKVWLVEPKTETLQEAGAHNNLQAQIEAVPMPNPALTLKNVIEPLGTDKAVVVWCPGTQEMYEFEGLGVFTSGPHMGEWHCSYAGPIPNLATFNGVFPVFAGPVSWGASASGLGILGGNVSMMDFVRILRGEPIGHALAVAVGCTASPEFVAPAVRADSKAKTNPYEFLEDKTTPNPAFGSVDAIREGLSMAFNPLWRAEEHGIKKSTEPFAYAFTEAIREHSLIVKDGTGQPVQFFANDPRVLGSIYSDTFVDPLRGTTISGLKTYIENLLAEKCAGWGDPTLPAISETFFGTTSIFSKIPWRELEQLEPRSS